MEAPLLTVSNINSFIGGSQILFNVSFSLKRGEFLCLLGRNGAGKSTTLKSIMGIVPPYTGSIVFKNVEMVKEERNPYACTDDVCNTARLGIGYVPEDRRIFSNLTVIENLELGAKKGANGQRRWNLDNILDLFPDLKSKLKRNSHRLSGGEKQMLTIARTLLGNPDLLLLDEPSEGLAPFVVSQMKERVEAIVETGISVILAEQNLNFTRGPKRKAIILEKGGLKFSGPLNDVLESEEIQKKYLGV